MLDKVTAHNCLYVVLAIQRANAKQLNHVFEKSQSWIVWVTVQVMSQWFLKTEFDQTLHKVNHNGTVCHIQGLDSLLQAKITFRVSSEGSFRPLLHTVTFLVFISPKKMVHVVLRSMEKNSSVKKSCYIIEVLKQSSFPIRIL